MTKEQIPSRISMPCPFGRNLGTGAGNITPVDSVQGNTVNFIDGFPSIYGAPSSNSGKFVTRKEMNGLGNLATNDLFYHKCGGLNTFDADFCAAIGGYPKGAVLQMVGENNTLFDVLSLVENNTFNFVENGVDNEHWRILNMNVGDPFVDNTVFSWEGDNTGGVVQLGTFTAQKNGSLYITKSPNIELSGVVSIPDPFPSWAQTSNHFYNGAGIVVTSSSTVLSPDNFNNTAIHAIGIKSLFFGQMVARLNSTPFNGTLTVNTKQFESYTLTKGSSYSVYLVNSVECQTLSATYSGGRPSLTGNSYRISGSLKIAM